MNPIASLFLRSARRAMPAAVALAVIGGGAAVAAQVPAGAVAAQVPADAAGGAPVKFSWHPFKLINGWKSASTAKLPTGTPAWALRDGIVYLRGAVKNQNPAASQVFAGLPGYARPVHNLYFEVYTGDAADGTVVIDATGNLNAFDGNAASFTSLAAVSFPLASVSSHSLKLFNGWESGQSMYNTGDPAYSVTDGVVYLSGSLILTGGGSGNLPPFRLPKAARPVHLLYRSVYTLEGNAGEVVIDPTGQLELFGPDTTGYTSLAGISYPVASTKWHSFKLENGWKSGAIKFHTTAPAYAVINGVVYLTGAMFQVSGDSGVWTKLPAAARPTDALEIEVDTNRISAGAIGLAKAGTVSNATFSNSQIFTSLAMIAYPVGS